MKYYYDKNHFVESLNICGISHFTTRQIFANWIHDHDLACFDYYSTNIPRSNNVKGITNIGRVLKVKPSIISSTNQFNGKPLLLVQGINNWLCLLPLEKYDDDFLTLALMSDQNGISPWQMSIMAAWQNINDKNNPKACN